MSLIVPKIVYQQIWWPVRSPYSDIHNRKALDSLSDIPLKEKDGVPLDHNRRLLSNSPNLIHWIAQISITPRYVPNKVTEWASRQSLKLSVECTPSVGSRGGISPEVSIDLPAFVWFLLRYLLGGWVQGGPFWNGLPHSLDREDRQDLVIHCRAYSNSLNSNRI